MRNDLFLAHASTYHFFSSFAQGCRVLDAGCGTGYGSVVLARAGARSVEAIDIDQRNIRFAKRHPHPEMVRFSVDDCQDLHFPPASFDLIVSSNVLEHLADPGIFLERAKAMLAPRGKMILVVPPITDEASIQENESISFHVSNLSVDDWLALFREHGLGARCYRHVYEPGLEALDFTSPLPSEASIDAFSFHEADREALYRLPTLSAVFHLSPT